ncbi:uncharacterized protein LOC125044453 [Penaeus chinensis]|uniref:uncharacterized protein LOC125044453 n=1 Tax=Penaeus chinensis TaxID=139456 RepID=UPI001FB6D6C7|nr:uncharacterized protein LOC125044453 [Penaeus chinensis]
MATHGRRLPPIPQGQVTDIPGMVPIAVPNIAPKISSTTVPNMVTNSVPKVMSTAVQNLVPSAVSNMISTAVTNLVPSVVPSLGSGFGTAGHSPRAQHSRYHSGCLAAPPPPPPARDGRAGAGGRRSPRPPTRPRLLLGSFGTCMAQPLFVTLHHSLRIDAGEQITRPAHEHTFQ